MWVAKSRGEVPASDLLAAFGEDATAATFELRASVEGPHTLTVDVEAWVGGRPHGTWIVRCEGLVEHRVALGQLGALLHTRRHELLIDYHEPHEQLQYFGGGPPDPDHVVSELQRAHHQVVGAWRPMTRYLTGAFTLPKFLRLPAGIVAHGPKSLMRAYGSVLEGNGMSTRLDSQASPRQPGCPAWVKDPLNLELLIFRPERLHHRKRGEPPPSFVIADRIVCDPVE